MIWLLSGPHEAGRQETAQPFLVFVLKISRKKWNRIARKLCMKVSTEERGSLLIIRDGQEKGTVCWKTFY